MALIGNNGEGKTTLLRILSGEAEFDGGSIERSKNLKIGYLPQDLVELAPIPVIEYLKDRVGLAEAENRLRETEKAMADMTGEDCPKAMNSLLEDHARQERIFEHLGGFGFEAMAARVLLGLGFASGDDERCCSEFSGGWKMRIAIAGLLLSCPDVMLLDEPTNHLDTESMEWLEDWLRSYRGAIIAVSHDRRFLENIADGIAELERGRLTFYPYSYERYIIEKELGRERLEKTVEEQKKRVGEIERFVERFRFKATKATQVQSRIRMLEKMEIHQLEASAKTVHFRIPEAPDSGWEVLGVNQLSKYYNDKKVFSDVSFSLNRGERVALVGVNGAGKSTLLRLLSGVEGATSGTVKLGHNVKSAFYSQESAQNVDYTRTIWEEARAAPSVMNDVGRRSLLGAFLFSGDDIYKSISVLSGGEKARLALFKLMLAETNFLILDEPTNHLDQSTKDLVQNALLQYSGTLLIVSHDRHFLDNLAERVIEVRNGRIYDYPGNYSWFLEKREERLKAEESLSDTPKHPALSKEDKKEAARERERQEAAKRALKKEIASLERNIQALEDQIKDIDLKLCSPEILADSIQVQDLMKKRSALEKTLGDSYSEWEELGERLT